MVEHQRLASAGYCYSASCPTFLVVAALKALEILRENPSIFNTLRKNTQHAAMLLSTTHHDPNIVVSNQPPSPLFHLRHLKTASISSSSRSANDEAAAALDRVISYALSHRIVLAQCLYSNTEKVVPAPSIRFCVSASQSMKEIEDAVRVLVDCFATL
jgi:7-keto-8-aminopelargonate synthetase-like enzyme